jgi:glutamyl-tRNA synthetase
MLENLLFPEIIDTPQDIIDRYPKRPPWQVVTRIAPSPTWFFHIWTLYTTIIDEIFAHKNAWVLFLRSEDTDQKREVEWAMKKYIDILKIFW